MATCIITNQKQAYKLDPSARAEIIRGSSCNPSKTITIQQRNTVPKMREKFIAQHGHDGLNNLLHPLT